MKLFSHFARLTHYLLIGVLLAGAIAITFTRLWLPGVDAYKHRLEKAIGEVLDGEVTIDHLSATIRGFAPELVLNGVAILEPGDRDQGNAQLAARKIRLGIDLPEAVRHLQFTPSWVTIIGARFGIYRDQEGAFQIEGLKASDDPPEWLFAEGRFELLESKVEWQDRFSGGPHLSIPSLDLTLVNHRGRHRLMVKAELPRTSGTGLSIVADYTGNIFEPACCEGQIYFETGSLHLPDFLTMSLPGGVRVQSGIGSFQLWGELSRSRLVDLFGQIDLQDVALQRGQDEATRVRVPAFSSWLHLQQDQDFWQLRTNRTKLVLDGQDPWPEGRYSIRGKLSEDPADSQMQLAASYFDVADFWPLLVKLGELPEPSADWLQQARPKGTVHDLNLYYRQQPQQAAQMTICGHFDQLGWQAWQQIPGIGKLSFHICGNDQQGKLVITAEDTALSVPQLPREDLWLEHLEGIFDWQQTEKGLISLNGPDVLVATADLISRSRIRLLLDPAGEASPFVDAQTHFRDFDPTRIGAYLPVNNMPKGGVDWLDQAFRKGNIRSATALFHGNLADFPFAGQEGIFEAVVELEETELVYNPQWPVIENLSARALFRNKSLRVTVQDGKMQGNDIERAHVSIANFSTSDYLQASGQVYGTVAQSLGFMQHSPLHALIDEFLEFISPMGHDRISVDLTVPIGSNVHDLSVDGKIQFLSAGFRVTDLKLDVADIQGNVTFDENNISAPQLEARVLGNPASLKFETRDGDILFDVDGMVSAEALASQFPGRIWKTLDGTTDYQVHLQIPRLANRTIFKTTLSIDSDLLGMAVNLPHPLGKAASVTSPFRIDMSLARGEKMPLNFAYGDHAQAIMQFSDPGAGAMRLESGAIVLGRGKPQLDGKPGVNLLARLDELHLDAWQSFLNREQNLPDAPPADASLRSAHLLVDELFIGGHSLGRFMMGLRRAGDNWEGQIHNDYAKGTVSSPHSLSEIVFDFDYLKVPEWNEPSQKIQTPAVNREAKAAHGADPTGFPAVQLTSQQLLWRNRDLGRLVIASSQTGQGVSIDRIELNGDMLQLSAQGHWLKSPPENGRESGISGSITAPSLGQLLENLGLTTDIRDTPAAMDFDLDWPGALYQADAGSIEGEVNIDLEQGSLLGVEPGVGRALGVLSLGTWQRRLRLDFSDLFGRGLAYDQIRGKFHLQDGKATTRNFLLDAVAARVFVNGSADMQNQQLDFIVSVTPRSTASLPIAGAIAGGPAVGAAILLAQQLVGEDVESITTSQYAVTGSWADPQVSELVHENGFLLKAWDGLMDFPWVGSDKESEADDERKEQGGSNRTE